MYSVSCGPSDASVTIIEFSDYQCPYCSRAESVVKQVLERYPDQVRFVYRHLPLESIHPQARAAAEAAVCAEDQGRFWEYHELLFANQQAISAAKLSELAEQVGLDEEAFASCTADDSTRQRVQRDISDAGAAGASGTPAFFVNGIPLSGVQPLEEFVELIDSELTRL